MAEQSGKTPWQNWDLPEPSRMSSIVDCTPTGGERAWGSLGTSNNMTKVRGNISQYICGSMS